MFQRGPNEISLCFRYAVYIIPTEFDFDKVNNLYCEAGTVLIASVISLSGFQELSQLPSATNNGLVVSLQIILL